MSIARTVVAALLLAVPATMAQTPADRWTTIETEHFRVHYPAGYETWARYAAGLLEPARAEVAAAVGYAPDRVVDVLLTDPVARSNALAIPHLGVPRMVLWATPPGADSTIGDFREWTEGLIVHEDVHLAHLLRPSRSGGERFFSAIVPVGPVAWKSPRWVIEGYATLLEGRITGSGRPYGDLRAAVLRTRALAGALPSYGGLDATGGGWLSGSMAYLAGSAYLEWLEQRSGPDALTDLWRRMSAREARTFDDAFRGVFGDDPATLYGRFRTEMTGRSLAIETAMTGIRHEGTPFVDVTGHTGRPALSPDGTRVAAVVRTPKKPAVLRVWSTEDDPERREEYDDRIADMLRRDPEDVAPVPPDPFPPKKVAGLPSKNRAAPYHPRFLPDGERILFVRDTIDADRRLRPDLFVWDTTNDKVRRVTKYADLTAPDPAPDGTWAVAVRARYGLTELVRVVIETGEVTTLASAPVGEVLGQPRISPDGTTIAYVHHRDGGWELRERTVDGGEPRVLGVAFHPAWSPDGKTLYAVVGDGGFLDIVAFPADGGGPRAVTTTLNGAIAPEPGPDGDLYFLGIEHDGLTIRRIEPEPAPPRPTFAATEYAPAVPPVPTAPAATLTPDDVPAGRRYGAGRQEWQPLAWRNESPSAGLWVVGARFGDVVGKIDTTISASFGDQAGPEGASVATAWRGWPVELRGALFGVDEKPSAKRDSSPVTGTALDQRRAGLSAAVSWSRIARPARGSVHAGGLFERLEPDDLDDSLDRTTWFLEGRGYGTPSWGNWGLRYGGSLRLESGDTGGDGWTRARGTARFTVRRKRTDLTLRWTRAQARDAALATDRYQVGGVESVVLPEPATSNRIVVPALPVGTLVGEDYEGGGATLRWSGEWIATSLFWETHRAWDGDADTDPIRLWGVRWTASTAPVPLVKLPALDFEIGVAQVLDPPFDNEWKWWLNLLWRP